MSEKLILSDKTFKIIGAAMEVHNTIGCGFTEPLYQEAFEEVASHSKEEILLEAPTIKDMGDRFLSSLSKIKSRVIIEEFDLEDISYVLLLSSLIKKGVEIKTLASVDSFNLIGDTSHALLISNSLDQEDFEYGAVYDDEDSVKNIKVLFESSWNLANDLDLNALVEKK